MVMAAPFAIDDLLMLCDDDDTQLASSQCSDTTGSDFTVDQFPELALDDEEYTSYVDADNVIRSDPFEAEGVLVVVDDTKSSTRRRTELKRLAANGWQRDEPTEKILGKRNLYTYRGPNGVDVETSLKRVMKQIRLSLIVDAVDMEELHKVTEQI